MLSFQHPRPNTALTHNHGSSPEADMKNLSMITVAFWTSVDLENSKNRLNVQCKDETHFSSECNSTIS